MSYRLYKCNVATTLFGWKERMFYNNIFLGCVVLSQWARLRAVSFAGPHPSSALF